MTEQDAYLTQVWNTVSSYTKRYATQTATLEEATARFRAATVIEKHRYLVAANRADNVTEKESLDREPSSRASKRA